MRRVFAVLAVSMIALVPTSSYAQQQRAPQSAHEEMMEHSGGFDGAKALAIGAGIIIGAVIVSSPMTVRGVTILGAVAGGLLANWWYNERNSPPGIDATKKSL